MRTQLFHLATADGSTSASRGTSDEVFSVHSGRVGCMSTDWTERELLVNLCVTAEEQRRLLEHLNSAERTGAVSSVAFEDMSKGDPKVSSKHYVGSPLTKEDVDAAWEIHAYA